MAAIITDQIRLLNAKNFVAGVTSTTNAYYSFIGLPNPTDIQTDWNTDPPSPKDNFSEENDYWDNMVALKKVSAGDCRQVVTKRVWSSKLILKFIDISIQSIILGFERIVFFTLAVVPAISIPFFLAATAIMVKIQLPKAVQTMSVGENDSPNPSLSLGASVCMVSLESTTAISEISLS